MRRRPYELLDDGYAPPGCDVLVIGCGSMLRGDDAVGPIAARTLWLRGVPDGVRIVDGGTAGMDVAFQMRGAKRVIVIDASSTGARPGTVFRVPGDEVAELPPLEGMHSHAFRWDHALSFARWLLGPELPTRIEVLLIEVEAIEPGAPLSDAVCEAMEQVVDLVLDECSASGERA